MYSLYTEVNNFVGYVFPAVLVQNYKDIIIQPSKHKVKIKIFVKQTFVNQIKFYEGFITKSIESWVELFVFP